MIVVGSGSLPRGVDDRYYPHLAEAADTGGARFILDTDGAPLRLALEIGRVYLSKPNLREPGMLVERELHDDAVVPA